MQLNNFFKNVILFTVMICKWILLFVISSHKDINMLLFIAGTCKFYLNPVKAGKALFCALFSNFRKLIDLLRFQASYAGPVEIIT